jgi:asparagine synthase (glutamine-hydrolysing)
VCGIVGILKLASQERADEARINQMRDVLHHRGPDGAGVWVEGPIGLGHRRLAIVDVTGGHQPMFNSDGSCCIVYNGEIYNHPLLQKRLESEGHHYKTRSDTETILHLYEDEGDRCVERLQGMFAFALWDRRRGRLLLARDRLGIKPLYYALIDRELIFASEIKAILASGLIRPSLNQAILPEFLANRFVSGAETFFRDIRKLLPGRTLTWSIGEGFRERRYWQLGGKPLEASVDGIEARAEDLRTRLKAAVRSHLMSDVPLGVFLSGGIDSSGIAALMASMVDEPIRTFAVGFDDPQANELAYAALMAKTIGARHHEIVVSPNEFFEALPHLIWHEDEPIAFPSSVPLYFVARLAREHVKVVLTGEGADELFLGYNKYRVTAWNEKIGRFYWALLPGSLRGSIAGLVGSLPYCVRRYAGRSFLALQPGPRHLFYENFAVFAEAFQQQLLADTSLIRARDPYADGLRLYAEASGDTLDRMSHVDLQTYLVELLMKQDQMSMAASIESRVPFLDHEFVEYVTGLEGHFKLRGLQTKFLLRSALQPLVPPQILTRKKMGFPVPVGQWFQRPFWPIVEELVAGPRALKRGLFDPSFLTRLVHEHRTGAERHGDRLWLLVNLEIWQRIFLDGEEKTAIMSAV